MIQGFDGLVTLKRAAFLRPVQIMRQFISNHDTLIRPYHRYEGLSRARKIAGNIKRQQLSLVIYKPSIGHMRICGYEGLRFDGLK